MTLIDSKVAALMLGSTVRHVQRLVARGLLVNRGPRRGRIALDYDEVAAAIDEGTVVVLAGERTSGATS